MLKLMHLDQQGLSSCMFELLFISVWCALYECVLIVYMWMKAWIKSVHHIQQSCVFRTVGLNGSIHMDCFYELFEASHFGGMDRNLIQNTFICLSKMNKSHPEVKMMCSCVHATPVWRSFFCRLKIQCFEDHWEPNNIGAHWFVSQWK